MVSYLIDTNILSEFDKKAPNPQVIEFIQSLPSEQIFISVVSLGEIIKGIEKLDDNSKKVRLYGNFEKKCELFDGKIIDLDREIMTEWGRLAARCERTLPVMDSLLAATCLARHLTLVTRNIKDFTGISGLSVLNPWETSQRAGEE
jgi:predicted nucleic acid-binding protein